MLSPQKPPFWLVKKGHECPGARSARDFTTTEIHDGTWNDQHTKIYKDTLSCSHPQKQLYHVIFCFILTCPIVLQCFVYIYIILWWGHPRSPQGTPGLCLSPGRHHWNSGRQLGGSSLTLKYHSGWWFQTCFISNNIWNNPYHWLIFFKMVKTTNESWNIMPKPMVGLECYNATLIVIHLWYLMVILHDTSW